MYAKGCLKSVSMLARQPSKGNARGPGMRWCVIGTVAISLSSLLQATEAWQPDFDVFFSSTYLQLGLPPPPAGKRSAGNTCSSSSRYGSNQGGSSKRVP